jgi:hypothetical protein
MKAMDTRYQDALSFVRRATARFEPKPSEAAIEEAARKVVKSMPPYTMPRSVQRASKR